MQRAQQLINGGATAFEAQKVLEQKSQMTKQFIIYNSYMLEPKDLTVIEYGKNKMVWINAIAMIPALGLNLFMGKLTGGRIYKWRMPFRVAIRLCTFVGPLAVSFYQSYIMSWRIFLYLDDKYGDRIAMFNRTGNPKMINPNLADWITLYSDFKS